jgi:hypothetical protein
MEAGIRLEGIDPNEIRVAVNNLGKEVTVFAETDGRPHILYFGDAPRSSVPLIVTSLYLHKDEKGNKCVALCGLVVGSDDTKMPIWVRIPANHLKVFLSEDIIYDFCFKIKKIKDDSIICGRRWAFLAPNPLSRGYVRRLIEEMKNPGEEDEACNDFQEKSKYPPCFKKIL